MSSQTSPSSIGLACLLVACGASAVMFTALAFASAGPFSGWFVPDGITLFYSARDSRGWSFVDVLDVFQASAGLAMLMAFLVSVHPLAPALFNVAALTATCAIQPQIRGPFGALALLACPYFLLSVSLPSKDIVVLLLFAIVLRAVWIGPPWRVVAIAIPVCGVMFFVRDGFAIMLAMATLAVALREYWRVPVAGYFAALGLSCAVFWTISEGLFEGSFLIARALAVAEGGATLDPSSITTIRGYIVRLVGNATNLAFRPAVLDTQGQFNVLAGAFWVSGVTLLVALLASARALRVGNSQDRRLGVLALSLLIMISVTPYVQPRYLLPLVATLPLFSFASADYLLGRWFLAACVSLAAALAYGLTGTLPPPAEVESFDVQQLLG